MEIIKKNESSSFFFDLKTEGKIKSLWINPSSFPPFNFSLKKEIQYEGFLFLHTNNDDKKIQDHYFVLDRNKIMYYEDEEKKNLISILNLEFIKLFYFINENVSNTNLKYNIVFSKYNKNIILNAHDFETFQIWIYHLRKCCILINFHKNYDHIRFLDQGSHAKIHIFVNKVDQKEYAVKIYEKEEIESFEIKENVKNEISILKIINHPCIIQFHEVYEGKDHIYIVMEYIKGKSLYDKLFKTSFLDKNNQLTINDIKYIIKQLITALDYLHNYGIFHRDIKLENILCVSNDKLDIKLIDFGLSDFYFKKNENHLKCGTPGYIAPEILNDKEYDTKIDVFSAGIIFYILLTKKYPFYHETLSESLLLNTKCEIDFEIFKKNEDYFDNECVELLKHMLEKNQFKRITTKIILNHQWFEIKENNTVLEQKSPKISVKIKKIMVINKNFQKIIKQSNSLKKISNNEKKKELPKLNSSSTNNSCNSLRKSQK